MIDNTQLALARIEAKLELTSSQLTQLTERVRHIEAGRHWVRLAWTGIGTGLGLLASWAFGKVAS